MGRFKEEFIDAYVKGGVNCIGIHSSVGDWAKRDLRKGLKWFPKRLRAMRSEMGIHFHRIVPYRRGVTKTQAEDGFDYLAGCCWYAGPDWYAYKIEEIPGVVLLKQGIPRERYLWRPKALCDAKYVPVVKGLENTTHLLVPRSFILDVIFLTREEIDEIVRGANERVDTPGHILYQFEKGKIGRGRFDFLWDKRRREISVSAERLLLYKSREHLLR